MDKTFSLMLDLSRFLAALLVFFYHAEQILKDNRLSLLASFGHDAVIFFFILSGFVIGYVSTHKEKELTTYAIARLARIYSVALPSFILVSALYIMGFYFSPENYIKIGIENWIRIFLSSFLFINQSHSNSIGIPTNPPYWSVCYEAWFYIIFGAAFYMKGKFKYLTLSIAVLVAGLKIIVLMPIWLLGFYSYKKIEHLTHVKSTGYLIIFTAFTSYTLLRIFNIDEYLFHYSANIMGGESNINTLLGWSKRFLPDFLIGLIFTSIFSGIYIVRNDFSFVFLRFKKLIKSLSSYTFSLYLYHYPILFF